MNTTQALHYDVVIMGAGFAGLCQARHLMLNIPNIRVALIDPRPENRPDTDLKIGESTVEIAALLICKELGLHDYMIENHPPKAGLNFHWPKNPAETDSIDDYYHVWINRQPPIPTFQINRAKFERDLLKMNKEMGAIFYNGRVVDVDLTEGDQLKTVTVKLEDTTIEITAKHIVDAAGRRFIIGKKTDNLIFGSDQLLGVNNGSAWVRIKDVDRTIFHSGYHPAGTTVSHYYATNHYFGPGHWLWMIPIDRDSKELSLGVIHHHDVIPSATINTQEKFTAFLKANHTVLYKLLQSSELVDFHYLPRVAHKSKVMFSPDNWYVVGDAACIFDAFYSLGTTMIAIAVESITEIVRAKLTKEANAEEKRAVYNEFNLAFTDSVNTFMQEHQKQLGHASIMSWRIYFEYMWWFGVLVPMYIGKWHLDPAFLKQFTGPFRTFLNGLFVDVYQDCNQLVERGVNMGLMDAIRADQLIGSYYTFKHFEDFLENSKLEPQRCNIFTSMKNTFFYVAIWYAMFQWKGFGWRGLLKPRNLAHFSYLLAQSGLSALGEMRHNFLTRSLPDNSEIEEMRQEFKEYRYQGKLQPWSAELS
ncbi:NAD(P)/FAD-dependent oxidoreductase [Microcystis aeruginosa]|jgi:flavin-dependent dehydrogenase|uniref:NAD(P)/FAD-dependent oxidoreductase n=1 Tax=Microcystis aeruginosa TaxID=1126 RepID=UPI00232FD591|nr:tryptophan 7-halogenase [Microcystis aeruginosa]MDB9391993.1 tryptophan 7-halogenase [Microcystis aeruginosa CS-579]